MKEHKFRAWDEKKKKYWSAQEMGEDQLTLSPDGRGFINVSGVSTVLSNYLPHLIPEEYTGFKDKNGKGEDLYQGDILGSGNIEDGVFYIDWHEKQGQWYLYQNENFSVFPLYSALQDLRVRFKKQGNIRETPELLK